MKNRKAKSWLLLTAICLMLSAGCQTSSMGDQQYNNASDNVNEGKGLKALYKKKGVNQADEDHKIRSIFRNAYSSPKGANGDDQLGKTSKPGTRMARSTIPYGYKEHSANDPEVIQQGYGADINIDREVLADAVAQIVVGLHNVTDSAVIVTDQDIIIGYKAHHNTQEDYQTQVVQAGESVTPRWYNVYATDDIELVRSLKEVTKEPSTDRLGTQLRKQVDFIIQQIDGQPKGIDGRKPSNIMNQQSPNTIPQQGR